MSNDNTNDEIIKAFRPSELEGLTKANQTLLDTIIQGISRAAQQINAQPDEREYVIRIDLSKVILSRDE
tara:strand:+ start:383 stop:589 length:207 start_codon:yes stop_codon:yes gene_type:complete